mgnify:FL=1
MLGFKFSRLFGSVLKTCALIFTQLEAAENWPMFRGGFSRGTSDNINLPLEWDSKKGKNIEWKVKVPGLGWSSPVVHSGRIYLTTAVSEGEIEPRKPGLYFGGDRKEPIKHMHHFLVLCLDTVSYTHLTLPTKRIV